MTESPFDARRAAEIRELCDEWCRNPKLPINAIPASPDDVYWLLDQVEKLAKAVQIADRAYGEAIDDLGRELVAAQERALAAERALRRSNAPFVRSDSCRCASGRHTCGLPNPEEDLVLALARVEDLEDALNEAIEWARRPSPIPAVPFDEFLQRMGKLGCGPRSSKQTVTKPADLPITGERPRDAGTSGAAT